MIVICIYASNLLEYAGSEGCRVEKDRREAVSFGENLAAVFV